MALDLGAMVLRGGSNPPARAKFNNLNILEMKMIKISGIQMVLTVSNFASDGNVIDFDIDDEQYYSEAFRAAVKKGVIEVSFFIGNKKWHISTAAKYLIGIFN